MTSHFAIYLVSNKNLLLTRQFIKQIIFRHHLYFTNNIKNVIVYKYKHFIYYSIFYDIQCQQSFLWSMAKSMNIMAQLFMIASTMLVSMDTVLKGSCVELNSLGTPPVQHSASPPCLIVTNSVLRDTS